MRIEFTVKPGQACMNVKVMFNREELKQDYFFLNRDFRFNHCFIDGESYDIAAYTDLISLESICAGFQVNKCTIPQSFRKIEMEYTGYLSGKSGSWPYVRESISPEFTFLRFETYCYPIFCNDDMHSLISFLDTYADVDLVVTVPSEFIAVSCAKEAGSFSADGMTTYNFRSDVFGFNVAIAKFKVSSLSLGKFYLLREIDSMLVENVLRKAHEFMNNRYGTRNISGVNCVAIPASLGSFAKPKTLFVDETTFKSVKSMNHIIHEFIHLGWNVLADSKTQRIRFFDEAFTCYFEMRVMEHILGENYRLLDLISSYTEQLKRYDKNVPIIDFGKYEYGDLSYTIGAICLYKLSELVGIEVFERATTVFLEKYKDIPVNMEIFCIEYTNLCNNPRLIHFFEDWIYSTNGVRHFVEP